MNYPKKIILLLIMLIAPCFTSAAGIQVSPSSLEIKANAGSARGNIVVTNPTSDVQLFEIYTDEFNQDLKINPTSFTLEAGKSKTIEVSVDPVIIKKIKSQIISTVISVIGKPLGESALSVNSGVKIPLQITIENSAQPRLNKTIIFLGGALLILLGLLAFNRKRKLT